MKQPVIEVSSLEAGYEDVSVLHDLSLSVKEGEFLGIVGPNGAGKSTLLRVLAGLMPPIRGNILLNGQPVADYPRRALARQVAVIFQEFSCAYDFTVFDIVAMGRSPYLARWGPLSSKDLEGISNAMGMTEITSLRNRLFFELSGGEKQRVIIAKALAQDPSLLFLDEPSSHLDIHHQVAMFEILDRLNRAKRVTILCITHDLNLASQYMSRFLFLKAGRLLADGSPEEVLERNLIEEVFQTPVSVSKMAGTQARCIYPLRLEAKT